MTRSHRCAGAVAGAMVAALLIGNLLAQAPVSPPQRPAAAGPTFDVISIKRNTTGTGGASQRTPTGGLIRTNAQVFGLILDAYPGLTTPPVGVPPWTLSERYDVTATASLPSPPTPEEQALMMRALLIDRFGLVAHMEQTEQDVLALVLARSDGRLGPGLTPLNVDCAAVRAEARQRAEAQKQREAGGAEARGSAPAPVARISDDAAPPCSEGFGMRDRTLRSDMTMGTLAMTLQVTAGRPVIDKTGLSGFYRVKLQAADLMQPGVSATARPSDLPSIFSALPEQLGLKLEPARAKVDTLVIERIQRPSEN